MSVKRPQRLWVLALVGVGVLAITVLLDLIVPYDGPLDLIIRGAAMAAYMTTFLSILSSHSLRELVRFFGTPFLKVHHYATVTSLILMTVHPVAVALRAGSPGVFVPVISSWYEFFLFGGRQAWYLFLIASGAALARRVWRANWRTLHWLSYLAFLFVTVHGILLGANFALPAVRVIALLMAVAVVRLFVLKRAAMAREKARRPRPR
ncbi:MAG: ferric reductase [Anaerolineae bacterium]|nr:ferric reductase [Anaerolineae bacterium]